MSALSSLVLVIQKFLVGSGSVVSVSSVGFMDKKESESKGY